MRLCSQERTKTRLNSHKLTCKPVTYCYHLLSIKSGLRHHRKRISRNSDGFFGLFESVSNQGLDVVNDGALGHGAMFELFFIKIANLRFHSQLKRIPIFLLTFPFPDSNLTPMDFRQKNTFKNSLGNWWWPNSHPEASLPR